MTLKVQYSNKFLKDIKLAKKRHLNTSLLHDVIEMLRTGQKLPEKYHDPSLDLHRALWRLGHVIKLQSSL